jgi:hypothetical protein
MQDLLDQALVALVILAILVGVPLLIVSLKDRDGPLGRTIKNLLGLASLLFGVTLLGWIVYNLFSPIPEFRSSYKTAFQLALPIVMFWYGWRWLRATWMLRRKRESSR